MRLHENHRLQTIFVLLQVGVIMAGSMLVGVVLKAFGYVDGDDDFMPGFVIFVRNWGFLLIFIPIAWTAVTINLEKKSDWFSKRWTIGSGILVLFGLVLFLFAALIRCLRFTATLAE